MMGKYGDAIKVFAVMFGLVAGPAGYAIHAWAENVAEEVTDKKTAEIKALLRQLSEAQVQEQINRARFEEQLNQSQRVQQEIRGDVKRLLERRD